MVLEVVLVVLEVVLVVLEVVLVVLEEALEATDSLPNRSFKFALKLLIKVVVRP